MRWVVSGALGQGVAGTAHCSKGRGSWTWSTTPTRGRPVPGRAGGDSLGGQTVQRSRSQDRDRDRDLRTVTSDYPEEVPAFLVSCGITSIFVTPDTLIRVRIAAAAAEAQHAPQAIEVTTTS